MTLCHRSARDSEVHSPHWQCTDARLPWIAVLNTCPSLPKFVGCGHGWYPGPFISNGIQSLDPPPPSTQLGDRNANVNVNINCLGGPEAYAVPTQANQALPVR